MLILAIFNGFLGYSLPDDLVSGTGIRIAFSIVESIPLIGSYMAFFLFGGNFPGDAIIPRFFILHVLVLPAVIVGLLVGAISGMLVRQKHTQFPGPGPHDPQRRRRAACGRPSWPRRPVSCSSSSAVTALLERLVPDQPDLALRPVRALQGELRGAAGLVHGLARRGAADHAELGDRRLRPHDPQRLLPRHPAAGHHLRRPAAVAVHRGEDHQDYADHQILDRPRDRPKRTAFGAAVFSFYFVLFGASATDVLANYLSISLNVVLTSFRFLAIIVPLIVFPVTYRICKELQEVPSAGKRKRANVVLRSAEGGYTTVPTEVRPGDVVPRIEPLPLDEDIELVPVLAGVRAEADGSAGAEDAPVPRAGAEGTPRPARSRKDSSEDGPLGGIFTIPRDYR